MRYKGSRNKKFVLRLTIHGRIFRKLYDVLNLSLKNLWTFTDLVVISFNNLCAIFQL